MKRTLSANCLLALFVMVVSATALHAQSSGEDRVFREDPALRDEGPQKPVRSEALPSEGEPQPYLSEPVAERPQAKPFWSASFDLYFAGDGTSSEVPGRMADVFSGAFGVSGRGRYGFGLGHEFKGFLESGVGLKLGVMSAEIEDARPLFHDPDLFGLSFGASFELGAGLAAGPISLSAGFAASTLGGVVEGEYGLYTDFNNDGIYEREDFTLDFGYWAGYIEASITSAPTGHFGGTGVIGRFYPYVGYNFREGQNATRAYSLRLQADLGSDIGFDSSAVFAEFGLIENRRDAAPDTFWFKLGMSFAFS